jgi:hypothetical protein
MLLIEKPPAAATAEGPVKLSIFEQKYSATPGGSRTTTFDIAVKYFLI